MILKIFKPVSLFVFLTIITNSFSGFTQNEKEIKIEKDVHFGKTINYKGEEEILLLDIYSPVKKVSKKRPVIMWMHGGGFALNYDKSQFYIVDMATRFAKRGYVCISINYRVRKKPKDDKMGTMNDALVDAMKGFNWIRKNRKKLGIDKSRIVIGGGSAGGYLGNHFCYRDSIENKKWNKSGIVAFVNLWGSPDETWGKYTIDKNDPPMIIVQGKEDVVVPYANSLELIKKLNKVGIKNELITIEGEGHTPSSYMDDFEVKIAKFLSDLNSKKNE